MFLEMKKIIKLISVAIDWVISKKELKTKIVIKNENENEQNNNANVNTNT